MKKRSDLMLQQNYLNRNEQYRKNKPLWLDSSKNQQDINV